MKGFIIIGLSVLGTALLLMIGFWVAYYKGVVKPTHDAEEYDPQKDFF